MIPSLEHVGVQELASAAIMIVPTIGLCLWQRRPFGLWILHLLLIEYLCLYWMPQTYLRVLVGLVITAVLLIVTERRVNEAL